MNNNRFPFAAKLLVNEMYCPRTFKSNRKFLLKELTSAKLKKGNTVMQYTKDDCIGKRKDKQHVLYLSTQYQNDWASVTTDLKAKEVSQFI